MPQNAIEEWLSGTLLDVKFSQAEAVELRQLLPQLTEDEISFLRNRAFMMARDQVGIGGETAIAIVIWLERITKHIDSFRRAQVANINSAHFSPGESCRRKLLDLCTGARSSLDISVFTISDDRLAQAIVKAHQRGVIVRIVTDNDKALDEGSDIDYLIAKGIDIRMDSTPNHMHHKFAIIDQRVLVNGSFNWTRSATDYNQENILVTDEPGLVAAYKREFESLWIEFSPDR
jgi:mitochondrial cardiolipin hydrolase